MNTLLNQFLKDPGRHRLFEQESLAMEAAELISTLMHLEHVSKAELARRIGKSKAFVTQLLAGSRNMTLHTFADLAFALGHKIEVSPAQLRGSRRLHVIGSVAPVRGRQTEWWVSAEPHPEASDDGWQPWLTDDEVSKEPGIAA